MESGRALLLLLILLAIFQLFFRYQYVASSSGAVWRVDRITGQTCEVRIGGVVCVQPTAVPQTNPLLQP